MLNAVQSVASSKFYSRGISLVAAIFAIVLAAAPANADLAEKFSKSNEAATQAVDHDVWDRLLGKYLADGPQGLTVFDYKAVSKDDRAALKGYLAALQKVKVTGLSRKVQMPYWINFYNALTVEVILENYPVESIRDIKSGLFSSGPWGAELVRVEGEDLSLDDIEHGILRPIWQDKRIHYVVNCASVGCPNLARTAYTENNTADLLEKGARDYINSPRGVRFDNGRIIASKLFSWYDDDFGNERELLAHLNQYAKPELKAKLAGKTDIYDYEYDWSLNAPQ